MAETFITLDEVVCPECGSDNYDEIMKTAPDEFLLSCNSCNEEFEVVIMSMF